MFQLLVPVVEQGVQSAARAEQSSDSHLVTKGKIENSQTVKSFIRFKVAWTYFGCWLCFELRFFSRNDLTDCYDFYASLRKNDGT